MSWLKNSNYKISADIAQWCCIVAEEGYQNVSLGSQRPGKGYHSEMLTF